MSALRTRERFACAALLAALTTVGVGCTTGPKFADPFNQTCSDCDDVGCDVCGGEVCCCKQPKRWSREWYAIKAGEPVGARQRYRAGKMWPPYPRPTGKRSQFTHTYHAAHYWPHPYICQDRAYVKQIVDTQVANGWVQETTLYEYHFEEETQLLTHAGHQHLRWILQEAPPERRVAFVQTALDEVTSQARLESVRVAACELVGEEGCPAIMLRTAQPTGTPAEYVDSIQRAIRDSLPEPRILYQALPSGTGGGEGG